MSASSGFYELSLYKQGRFPHSEAWHEFTKVKICTLYHENMLCSVLMEASYYQDTLAMNLWCITLEFPWQLSWSLNDFDWMFLNIHYQHCICENVYRIDYLEWGLYPFTHNSTDWSLLPNPWIWSKWIGILNSFNDCWVKFALRQDWGTFTKERDITKIMIQISCHWNV